ncbi:MAG: alanine--tRNA ligase [Candidatus Fermentibacteraceae bacterium]|nr:alanine--tRNA ligase [Candidatus Fermentibacteraceae bacterium]
MTERELVNLYISFFEGKGHKRIAGASVIPENDSTILFTPAGMQPLVPYLLGEKHPQGSRLVNVQKCIRTGDIEEVGDDTHLTFFRMLGNWSLGSYFKREAILWSFEFLTGKEWLGFDPEKISVTVFAGEDDIPADAEARSIWLEAGIPEERIHSFGMKDNWWGPTGATGPCGPDTEMFFDTGKEPCGDSCKPGCSCGKYFEVWNDVFMEYRKTETGVYEPLAQKNVDTGMGVERTVAMLGGYGTVYDIGVLKSLIDKIRTLSKADGTTKSERVIADHIRSATHILGDDQGVVPSNVDQGYVLRRLIRLAIRHGMKLEIPGGFLTQLAVMVIEAEGEDYPELLRNRAVILSELEREEKLFGETLQAGLKQFNKMLPNLLKNPSRTVAGRLAFKLYDTYGFPVELTADLAAENGMSVDMDGYNKAFEKHRQLSKQGAEKKFKGGLADNSEMVTKLHTATHLLHAALRKVLGETVQQKGSNITAERLRFDFLYGEKMTDEQKLEVEALVNDAINAEVPVVMKEMSPDEAEATGALGFFKDKYGDIVKVYSIGSYSTEICGGPHVNNTSELGRFRLVSEKSSSRGVRRIKAVLE